MMNLLLAVLLPFLITTSGDQTASNIEVVEIFRAETTEELEAALADGYPMPWLAEILNDESIPEEDRYWLDCRVRAEIAQDLHLFFNEDGNPVHYEADRIRSGENYWRECFIVNLPGVDEQVADPPEGHWAGIGLLVDRYGNEIGEIAISNSGSRLSRDGSVGVTQSGIQGRLGDPGLMNLCFFYPDGSFSEFPIHHYTINETISQSGELVVVSCRDRSRNEEKVHKLYVFDGNANLLFEKTLSHRPSNSSSAIAISSDNRYIAVSTLDLQAGSYPVILYNADTSEELHNWDLILGNILSFSPDSRYLCMAGGGGAGVLVDCESGEVVWSRFLEDADNVAEIEQVRSLYCTNSAEIIYWYATRIGPTAFWTMITEHGERVVIDIQTTGRPGISPNGHIYVSQNYLTWVASLPNSPLQFRVAILRDGE